MPESKSRRNPTRERSFLDYLLYAMAGSVVVALSFSVLLWLRL